MKILALILGSILAIHLICWSMIVPFPPWHQTPARYTIPVQLATYLLGILLHALASLPGFRTDPAVFLMRAAGLIFLFGALLMILLQGGPHMSGSLLALTFISIYLSKRRRRID